VKNQYDIQREKVADKVIVDAGSCEGTFSLLCLLQGAKKVIAIDPSKSMCEYFRKTAIDNGFGKSFQIIQAGLWDKKMKGYTQNAQEIGTLSISKKGPDSEEIVLTALDSIHKRVDLIKMDIEGAEKHALLGAKTCMKKYKPTLCVTTYHHKGDQAILSNLIQKIEPSYRISHHNFAEPILIAHAPQKN
jgi:FkbM family methyltransferase